jgi:hypothetical protein
MDQVYFTPFPGRYRYTSKESPTFHVEELTELLTILR